MKLSHKLVMVSAAALMGVSPVVGSAVNTNVAFAATKKSKSVKVYNTMGKHSRIKPTKTMYFVNNNGKKTSKKAYKNGNYIIYNVKEVNGETYFSIQSDLKYWIPATATRGSVQYQDGNKLVTITTDGKKVVQTEKTLKSSSKKSTKSDSKKSDEKSTSSKKSTKKTIKVTNIVAKRKAQVYDKNGKKAKTYMGSKKWTIIGKGVQVKGLGTKTIDGVKYYALQPNHYYVKASDFTIKK
ncbi:SLAP domain-containing protein [Lactobacillus intestinalis]|uniref:SLAP domain-containing protein n=1 Tax=Lactobacillus intestinalis TaxID=151781 RepID=UPI00266F79CC|nr:SLAP domain-containing protein [Lactobacillus intestinalis]